MQEGGSPLKIIRMPLLCTAVAALLCSCTTGTTTSDSPEYPDAHTIVLSASSASLDGETVTEYDYVWHADPTQNHDEVKDAPAEYYTGMEPSGEDAVYIAHDIAYYPRLPAESFQLIDYDGDREYACFYPDGAYSEYIFATLPVIDNALPETMMHTEEEAYENPVLHITQPGTYILEGEWQGQILINLGDPDETFTDPDAKVTLILNGVDVTCTVAPAMMFYSAFECDNSWEDRDAYSSQVNTADAGANVILADGTENNFTGSNVYRMLKTRYKDDTTQSDGAKPQKKMRKTDAAFYSYVSMNIDGEEAGTGVLNVTSTTYEGLDSELHLTLNGGQVNIYSQDDGINVNEDSVSVVTINGGQLHINAGLGTEGDGIDSNGYLVINGGTVISAANPRSDSGLDSDCGSFINGGTVVSTGSTMDWPASQSGQATINLRFATPHPSDEAIVITKTDGTVVFAYDPSSDEAAGSHIRNYQGAVLSCPGLAVGESYHVYVGGNVIGTDSNGLYDPATVTDFTGAVQQQYTGTGGAEDKPNPEGTRPPQPNGNPPEVPSGTPPELPDSETPPQWNLPNQPTGTPPDSNGTPPEPPAGNGYQPNDRMEQPTGDASVEFTLTAPVTVFSNVADKVI